MSPRERTPSFDGDQGAIRRYTIRDGAVRDLSSAAVEVYYETEKGVSLGMVPGVIVGVKSGGKIDVMLRGRETDFDGLGGTIVEIPKVYYATAPDGTPAVNLLTNPSFDTDTTPANGIADGWSTFGGGPLGTYAVYASDSAPPTIFGNFQLINHNVLTDPDNFYQGVVSATVTGDEVSAGVWVRGDLITIGDQSNARLQIQALGGATDFFNLNLPGGTFEWAFKTLTGRTTQNHTDLQIVLRTLGATGSWRFDDAFLFKGAWMTFFGERKRIPVKPCGRPTKSTNQIAGFGSFEQDSDANGIADGWVQVGVANTYSINQDPAHVALGSKSQKVAPGNGAPAQTLYQRHRGKFKAGEVWGGSIKYKNSGALTGTPADGREFGIYLRTDYFNAPYADGIASFPLTSTAAFVTISTQVTIPADCDVLLFYICLAKIAGANIWLDDVQLWRVSP